MSEMIGKQLNDLKKTVKIVANVIPTTDDFKIIDAPRIMMMSIRSLDSTSVLGVDDNNTIDIKDIPALDDKEEFTARIENGRYILANDDTRYSILLKDEAPMTVRVPKIGELKSAVIKAKTVQDAVKSMKGISDVIHFRSDNEYLYVKVANDKTVIEKKLGKCHDGFKVAFPFEYVENLCKVVVGDIRMEFDTDHPTIWTWRDAYYEYSVMLAPRVERE